MRLELSRAALERLLLGEDGKDIEFVARQQIVEAFCKEHIKTFLNSEVVSKTMEALRNGAKTEIAEKIGVTVDNWRTNLTPLLKNEVRLAISAAVNEMVDEAISLRVEQMVAENLAGLVGRIDKAVRSAVDSEIKTQARLQVEQKLKDKMDEIQKAVKQIVSTP